MDGLDCNAIEGWWNERKDRSPHRMVDPKVD
jgi:hypothetical protein